jgi:hypothetical protein
MYFKTWRPYSLLLPFKGDPFENGHSSYILITLGLATILTHFDDDGWELVMAHVNQFNNKT